MRVEVKPELLRWAGERAGLDPAALALRFPQFPVWEQRKAKPTLKQIEQFAKAVHAPVGYLFLPEPPRETVPLPDFRSPYAARLQQPSPDLLDTIYICQQRQEWYRDFARLSGDQALPIVGAATVRSKVVETAAEIRRTLRFDVAARRDMPTWNEALRRFIEQADNAGIMVMCSGVVQNNNHRHLDPQEFRGFAMADPLAPLIFINGADTKAAQMFTLAHELAHIWLGQSALSDTQAALVPEHKVERWCNQVAAEMLVPLAEVRAVYRRDEETPAAMQRLARHFKVSSLVILRRLFDCGAIEQEEFTQAYQDELDRLMEIMAKGGGGNFYLTQAARVSKRFARALVQSTLEGQTLYRDAFRLLGFAKMSTFNELGRKLGVA